ncbi:polysaccharide pyruvyl transferase family protein [Paraclostridium bifermentans]|uniref:polysaccharide pyruvyl transferase family protein n=1 Tax=Paraclostridium bifermentans TaxID=1490 RepID=UPI0025B2059A|nr:polysaccharide pyruvyl transferase family protein [Paraclostridium bifermentans]
MKASVITIKGLYNYGAVLQGYATCEYLNSIGCDVELIDYYPEYFEKDVPKIKKLLINLVTTVKRRKLERFVRENIKLTKKTYRNINEIKNDNIKSDVYVVGSDQVWNSQLSLGRLDPAYFLDFTNSKNKIAISSSIGRTDVTDEELKEMKEYLKSFSSISVREQSAKDLLERIGVEDIVNILDPVFLLEMEDYKKFIRPVNHKKYLLIYSFERNETTQKIANEIAKRLNLKIVEIGIFKSKYDCDKYEHNAGIEEFLSLIHNAEFIVTSSFHGTAFSILLNKQFISVAPTLRKTRLENITSLFGISDRLITEKSDYDIEKIIEPIEYTDINKLIKENSDKGRNFIKNAIGKID